MLSLSLAYSRIFFEYEIDISYISIYSESENVEDSERFQLKR